MAASLDEVDDGLANADPPIHFRPSTQFEALKEECAALEEASERLRFRLRIPSKADAP
jgi:hypothetical protein